MYALKVKTPMRMQVEEGIEQMMEKVRGMLATPSTQGVRVAYTTAGLREADKKLRDAADKENEPVPDRAYSYLGAMAHSNLLVEVLRREYGVAAVNVRYDSSGHNYSVLVDITLIRAAKAA